MVSLSLSVMGIRIRRGYRYPSSVTSIPGIHIHQGCPYLPRFEKLSTEYPYPGQVDFRIWKRHPGGSNSISKADRLWLEVPVVFASLSHRLASHWLLLLLLAPGETDNLQTEAAMWETNIFYFPIHFAGWRTSNGNQPITAHCNHKLFVWAHWVVFNSTIRCSTPTPTWRSNPIQSSFIHLILRRHVSVVSKLTRI